MRKSNPAELRQIGQIYQQKRDKVPLRHDDRVPAGERGLLQAGRGSQGDEEHATAGITIDANTTSAAKIRLNRILVTAPSPRSFPTLA
jgi:hypothetical protein